MQNLVLLQALHLSIKLQDFCFRTSHTITLKVLLLILLLEEKIELGNFYLGNSMVSSAIWEKHARVSFSKTYKIARVRRTSAISAFMKNS